MTLREPIRDSAAVHFDLSIVQAACGGIDASAPFRIEALAGDEVSIVCSQPTTRRCRRGPRTECQAHQQFGIAWSFGFRPCSGTPCTAWPLAAPTARSARCSDQAGSYCPGPRECGTCSYASADLQASGTVARKHRSARGTIISCREVEYSLRLPAMRSDRVPQLLYGHRGGP